MHETQQVAQRNSSSCKTRYAVVEHPSCTLFCDLAHYALKENSNRGHERGKESKAPDRHICLQARPPTDLTAHSISGSEQNEALFKA